MLGLGVGIEKVFVFHSKSENLGVGVRVGLEMFFDTNSIQGLNSVDGVCDFESVPPDQLSRRG